MIPATILFAAGTFALAALGGCDVLDPDPEAAVTKDTTVVEETGERLYLENCAGCHGLNGKPTDSVTVLSLQSWPGSFEKFDSSLTSGPGAMPDYPHLNAEQRRKIFDHVKKF